MPPHGLTHRPVPYPAYFCRGPGFCLLRRAPFLLWPLDSLTLNFMLVPCPLTNQMTAEGRQYVGEVDRYLDALKEEVFPLTGVAGLPLELVVSYGERRKTGTSLNTAGRSSAITSRPTTPRGSSATRSAKG